MKNELQLILKDSDLSKTQISFLTENFKDAFELAKKWEKKAKEIVVTKASQIDVMEIAHMGRIELKNKRCALEKVRKKLKKGVLAEGRAIDRAVNYLKDLIIPSEDYLDKQENFVKYKEEARIEKLRIKEEKRIEKERVAEEKAEEKTQAELEVENKRLQKIADDADKKAAATKKIADDKLKKTKADANEKVNKAKEIADKKLEKEERKHDKIKIELENKAKEEQVSAEKKIKKANDKVNTFMKKQSHRLVTCPYCNKTFELGE